MPSSGNARGVSLRDQEHLIGGPPADGGPHDGVCKLGMILSEDLVASLRAFSTQVKGSCDNLFWDMESALGHLPCVRWWGRSHTGLSTNTAGP